MYEDRIKKVNTTLKSYDQARHRIIYGGHVNHPGIQVNNWIKKLTFDSLSLEQREL
jgi:hypothetical protein